MKAYKIYLLCFSVLLMSCNSSEGDWIPLFNEENLDGWHAYGADATIDGWYIENGELIYDFARRKGGASSNLVTNDKYTNFELSLEWNIGKQGNSGIFWGVIEEAQYEHPYETGPEIQVLDDNWTMYVEERGDINRAGSLYGLLPPSKIVSKAAGQWNHYLLHIDHNKNVGFLKFNGQEVLRFPVHGPEWEAMIAKSNFAKWSAFGTARTGHISLQEYGGKVAFRDIELRVLPSED
ncbi:MAG: DUF1080 domain-containing protein [Maribacter sp.]|nr:DUF1080 domain-containing protein [Maribacter sp.]